jgi:hypothetical protein
MHQRFSSDAKTLHPKKQNRFAFFSFFCFIYII